jgi:NAD(P)-dependent dehydrogenase (short-subunit alcohol dehydrogenase family)
MDATEQPLRGQVAIVTGAGRGVGRAIAAALARSGAAVALASRSVDELRSAATELEALGAEAVVVPTDVIDEQAVANLVAEASLRLGPPTLLVNAAGSWTQVGPVEEADPGAWWSDIEVSLKGTFLCTREVLPGMISRGAGRIVNLSSYAAVSPRPYASSYAAAKAAVLRFSDSLAAELEGRGVFVFAVTPGFVHTQLVERVASSPAGRRYLPELSERADALEPERVGRLVADIATGRLDVLAGRFLHVLDDVDDLVERADEIRRRDLYTLGLRT